jgi:uncharacterized protein YjbI with pentapeptide repeats
MNRRAAGNRRLRIGPPREPKLPDRLTPASDAPHDLEHEQRVEAVAYHDVDLAGTLAEGVEFHRCDFRKAGFAGAHLPGVRVTDCVVQASDLSNVRLERARLERVKLTDCRATGMAANDGMLTDVAFIGCKAPLANWRFTRFEVVTFQDCSLPGADFTEADLRGATFIGCDLSRAQFHKATMAGARFRRCELQGIGGITNWEGAIVHRDDLLELSSMLAGALGIVIESDEE